MITLQWFVRESPCSDNDVNRYMVLMVSPFTQMSLILDPG